MNSQRRQTTKAPRTRRPTKNVLYQIFFFTTFVSSWFTGFQVSSAAGESARQIVEEAQKRTDAKSQRYEGLLQVFDSKGKISDKRWNIDRLGSHGDSKAVLRFTAPAEVKGVALLIVNHADRASDQWMWTPAIERDRRIALQDRATRFFGTDFSFEDLEERDVNQYEYSLLGDETVEGAVCWKIQSTPKEAKSSQYSRSQVWIRKDNYALVRVENYLKDRIVRRLIYSDFANIQGIWTARTLEMSDLVRGSRTRLSLDKLQYNVPMKDEDFTLQAIRHQ
jgi:outer membrane lipoprotein-sorting protein